MSDLVERLRHLVRLNEPQHGGPYAGHAAAACIKAMTESADELARLHSEVERLTRERKVYTLFNELKEKDNG